MALNHMKTRVSYKYFVHVGDRIKTTPDDLSKLTNVLDNDVVKTIVYDGFVTKVNLIDTRKLVKKLLITQLRILKKFNNFLGEIVDEKLKEAKFTAKADTPDFTEKTYFDEKIREVNNKVTSNQTKDEKSETKLNHDITSYIKVINRLLREVSKTSAKIKDFH